MSPDSREEKNALAFLDVLIKEAGHVIRPVSYLTTQNVQLLDLVFGKGKEAYLALEPEKRLDQFNAYLFIQTAPGLEVRRAIREYRDALKAKSPEEAFEEFIGNRVEPFVATLGAEKKTSSGST